MSRHRGSWALAGATIAVVYIGCGDLPDWSDIEFKVSGGGGGDSTGTGSGGDGTTTSTGAAGTDVGGVGGSGVSAGGSTGAGGSGTGGMVSQGGNGGTGATVPDGGGNQTDLDKQELTTALAKLNGFVYTNACKFSNNGSDVTTLAGCSTGDICWDTAGLGQFKESRQIAIAGTAGHVYEVTTNILGVIEPRDYPAAPNCWQLTTGGQLPKMGDIMRPAGWGPMPTGDFIAVRECQDGFANKNSVTFNVYEFAVPAPAHKYYFNTVNAHPPHRVDKIDDKFVFQVNANTTINFNFDDLNGGEIRNCTNSQTTSKYTTADGKPITANPSVAQPFNGNWFQLTVIDAKIVQR